MIFEKNSTRTRVSFETGMFQLGGHALFLSRDDIQLGRGETIGDTAKVLSRYVDGIMIRAYSHAKVTELARCATIPVINGLTDLSHPCQALSDFFTIYEREKDFKNIKMAYVGDGNNVAHSLMLCAALLGMDLAVASPKNYQPDTDIAAAAFRLSSDSGAKITLTTDINLAVENAHYLYTDVWISMGQEREAGKRKSLRKLQDHEKIMQNARNAARLCTAYRRTGRRDRRRCARFESINYLRSGRKQAARAKGHHVCANSLSRQRLHRQPDNGGMKMDVKNCSRVFRGSTPLSS